MSQEKYKELIELLKSPDSDLSFEVGPGPGKWVAASFLVEWIMAQNLANKRKDAISLGHMLYDRGQIVPAKTGVRGFEDSYTLYRVVSLDEPVAKTAVATSSPRVSPKVAESPRIPSKSSESPRISSSPVSIPSPASSSPTAARTVTIQTAGVKFEDPGIKSPSQRSDSARGLSSTPERRASAPSASPSITRAAGPSGSPRTAGSPRVPASDEDESPLMPLARSSDSTKLSRKVSSNSEPSIRQLPSSTPPQSTTTPTSVSADGGSSTLPSLPSVPDTPPVSLSTSSNSFVPSQGAREPRQSRVMLGNRRISAGDPTKSAVSKDEPEILSPKERSPEKESSSEKTRAFEPAVFVVKHPDFTSEESYVTVNTKAPIQELIDAVCESSRIAPEELLFSETQGGPELSSTSKLGSISGRLVYLKYLGPQAKKVASPVKASDSSLRTPPLHHI